MTSHFPFPEKSTRSLTEFDFLQDPKTKNSKLGKGTFASVKLVKEKKTQNLFALKIISVNPARMSRSELQNLQNEVQIHRQLDHPNIIKFHGHIMDGLNLYLILDYAENGNLYDHLHKKKILTPNEIFQYFHQTCLAIQYLHENNVLHRDLKPENLLLDKDLNVKLCDFGWAAKSIREKKHTFCGTYEYMAPEIVKKKPYDYRVDIWSLGVLLYELVHRQAPYRGRNLTEISNSLSKPALSFSASIQPEIKDLILKILQINPEERISIKGILEHPWIKYHLSKQELQEYISQGSLPLSTANTLTNLSKNDVSSPMNNIHSQPSSLKSLIARRDVTPTLQVETSNIVSTYNDTEPEVAEEKCLVQKDFTSISIKCTRLYDSQSAVTSPKTPMTGKPPMTEYVKQKSSIFSHEHNLDSQSRLYFSPASATLVKSKTQNYDLQVQKTPSDLVNRKLFETNIMSPEFKARVDRVIGNITPVTTRTQTPTPGNPSNYFFASKIPTHKRINSSSTMNTDRNFNNLLSDKSATQDLRPRFRQQVNQEQTTTTNMSVREDLPVLDETHTTQRDRSMTPVNMLRMNNTFADATLNKTNVEDKKLMNVRSHATLYKQSSFVDNLLGRHTPDPVRLEYSSVSRFNGCATPTPMGGKLFEDSPNPKPHNIPFESVKSCSYKKSRIDDKSVSNFALENSATQKGKETIYSFDVKENMELLKEIKASLGDKTSREKENGIEGFKTNRRPIGFMGPAGASKMFSHR